MDTRMLVTLKLVGDFYMYHECECIYIYIYNWNWFDVTLSTLPGIYIYIYIYTGSMPATWYKIEVENEPKSCVWHFPSALNLFVYVCIHKNACVYTVVWCTCDAYVCMHMQIYACIYVCTWRMHVCIHVCMLVMITYTYAVVCICMCTHACI